MIDHRTGILIRFPLRPKKGKSTKFSIPFCDFMNSKIAEGTQLGYKCFIFELADEDFDVFDFTIKEHAKIALISKIKEGCRVSLYLKSKKYITSDIDDEIRSSFEQIHTCIGFIEGFKFFKPQEFPLILHIGGAKGNRKATMDTFCARLETWLTPEAMECIAVVNDEKPSLFSVKDLLSGIFYKTKIPIVFRSTSYPTNQGNLTLNESLFLASSTWKRNVNPIFVYLPGSNIQLEEDQTRPFGLELDFVFDNILPEP
jgi:UV DNA damage repair endonuclease